MKNGVTELVFELKALKTKIKGVFNQVELLHEDDHNLFNNDWAFVWYQYT